MVDLWNLRWLSLIVLVGLLTGCGSDPEAEPQAVARRVSVVPVEVVQRAERFVVSGRVEASREALLSFKAGGIIETLAVDEGDRFAKGDLLAALDTTEIGAMVVDAVEQREQAERALRRMRSLYEQEAVALQALQDAETGLERAKAAERRAKFVAANSILHAPYPGHVANRLANEGELVGEGSPVLRIVGNGSGQMVRAGVPARLLPLLHVGDEATVTVETIEESLTATIRRIGAVAERGTGNFLVELTLPEHEMLREGLVATVELRGPARELIALPGGALAGGDSDRGVFYIVRNDTALRREVRIQRLTGDSVYIEPVLAPETPVIVDGAGFLSDGERVDVVERTEPAP